MVTKNNCSFKKKLGKNGSNTPFFYFDLADESHEKLEENMLKPGEEPLRPLTEITRVEY